MTRFRVVALAAILAAPSLCLTLAPASKAKTIRPAAAQLSFDRPPLFPGLGLLLVPRQAGASWPDFIDPYTIHGVARRALLAIQTRARTPLLAGPALSHRQRRELRQHIDSHLPRYDHLFERAARRHGLPASLIAAVAYIESRWRPDARYQSTVGLMMLSPDAADLVGVNDRQSAAQSIRGGADYLKRMQALIPSAVPFPDRNNYALAAYNMGIGHLRDAVRLAQQLGFNPYLWADLRQVIPLLSDKRYYRDLRHGYARGEDVVKYVERVRRCQALIAPQLD
ncbi:transglycosylase SLT domain-containing protein [Salinisphaera sp. SPP-AMP-43]|uniref:transglycosylase SLT domain-containing protein n=1 Tax=Salinisphaera sp. SPP-AMP-43 TaxID=3121288 RepID=UPI003C6E179A